MIFTSLLGFPRGAQNAKCVEHFDFPVNVSRCTGSLCWCQVDGGSPSLWRVQAAVSSNSTKEEETACHGCEAGTNPAPYGPSCDYACVQALLSRVSFHRASDKKSDACV